MGEAVTSVERATTSSPGIAVARSVAIGDVLGTAYELRELLATTESYTLFAAHDRVLGREVAIKVVSSDAAIEVLRREARMLAPIAHAGLPAIFGYGIHGSSEYLVSERVRGTTLAAYSELRAARGGFATYEVISILVGIADALAVLHANGYVHGNLSRDAVVIAADGRIVVRDPVIVGEVVPGEGGDVRSDLRALGLLGYELFTGTQWSGQSLDRIGLSAEATRVLRDLLPAEGNSGAHDAAIVATALRGARHVNAVARQLTVVVADDDDAMRALLVAALRATAAHVAVYEAPDGVAALELVERHQPDLLLLDLDMPRLDGVGVCTFLRGTRARDSLAICVMSKFAESNRPVLARLGVVDAFQKGQVPPERLPAALGDLLRRLRLLEDIDAQAAPSLVGGRYQIGRQLGAGGMGLVYEARHIQLGRPLALKMISPDYALDAAARARFQQEARLSSEIVHPNIVPVIDFGEDRHVGPFMVMELVTGESLADLATKPLTIRRATDLLGQVTDAVAQIHARGIVHGDIKAENILVCEEHVGTRTRRIAKLLDFGLARRITSMQATSEVITGTPHYIAPERTNGGPASVASDVYALGVLGYLLFSGSLPFEGTAPDIMAAHRGTTAEPLTQRRGQMVDTALETLISRAMEKSLSARHPSASAFRYELNNAVDMLDLRDRNARTARRGTLSPS